MIQKTKLTEACPEMPVGGGLSSARPPVNKGDSSVVVSAAAWSAGGVVSFCGRLMMSPSRLGCWL